MKKRLGLGLILILTTIACDGKPITADQNVDAEFGMNCVGVVRGIAAVTFYRCENNEVVCYASYNGSSISCDWKSKGE